MLSGYRFQTGPIAIAAIETVMLAPFGWWAFTRLEPTTADRI
jgi:hypothetical protein